MDATVIRRSVAAILVCEFSEETKPKRTCGKTREWIKIIEERGAYVNIARELGVEDSGVYKDMPEVGPQFFL